MAKARTDLLQGTLELLILKTLSQDSMHGTASRNVSINPSTTS
jgi:hypothetical protein